MTLPADCIVRIARLVRLDADSVRRVLEGDAPAFLRAEQARHVEALARETLARLPACHRVRDVRETQEAAR